MCIHLHKRLNPKLPVVPLRKWYRRGQRERRREEKALSHFTLYSSLLQQSFICNKYI